jgi:hypothetical protein
MVCSEELTPLLQNAYKFLCVINGAVSELCSYFKWNIYSPYVSIQLLFYFNHGLIYSVVPGDTLTSIAEKLDVPLLGLEQVNEQIQDFDLIFPGEVIQVPVGLQGHLSCGDAFYLPTQVSKGTESPEIFF